MLKQINRFYDMIDEINKAVALEGKDAPAHLFMDYFQLTAKTGTQLQYAIGHLKDDLDNLESE